MTGIRKAAVLPEPKLLSIDTEFQSSSLTGLRDADDVLALNHRWDNICLDRCWRVVSTSLDVLHHQRMETSIFKLEES